MNRTGIIFCTMSMVVVVFLAWALYPLAAMTPKKLAEWTVPVKPSAIPDVNMGEFGKVSVNDLVSYYIENPPAPPASGAAPVRRVHLQGC